MRASDLETLYRRHRRRALNRLSRLMRDPTWAEDVLQECFARLLEPHASWEGRADVGYWLDRVLAHRALSELRRKVPLPDPPEGTLEPADALFERAEACLQLRRALAQLGERDRRLISLHHFEELGLSEIAARLGLPEGTVKSGLSRARVKLAACFEAL